MRADVVTEIPGTRATPQQLQRALHRYGVVAGRSAGKDVLEVACGTGQGLAAIARVARSLVAGDLEEPNVLLAKAANEDVPVVRFDARRLPFVDGSFDVVALLEAIYYLPDAKLALEECWRVLRPGGLVVVASVNPAWRDFGPAPFSTRYWGSQALSELVHGAGFGVQVFAAFRASADPASRAASVARRVSSRLRLRWPHRARWAIRRVLHGPIRRFPPSLGSDVGAPPLDPVPEDRVDADHQVLYAIGEKIPR